MASGTPQNPIKLGSPENAGKATGKKSVSDLPVSGKAQKSDGPTAISKVWHHEIRTSQDVIDS